MAADKWMQERAEELVGAYTGNLPAILLRAMEEQRERDRKLVCFMCKDGFPMVPGESVHNLGSEQFPRLQDCRAAAIRRGGE